MLLMKSVNPIFQNLAETRNIFSALSDGNLHIAEI
ncbi:MAG: hypothetical protein ACJAZP_003597 [Psychromonas sp.]|jgi:hypothetical protein